MPVYNSIANYLVNNIFHIFGLISLSVNVEGVKSEQVVQCTNNVTLRHATLAYTLLLWKSNAEFPFNLLKPTGYVMYQQV